MSQTNPLHAKKSGILLHPTSLPSEAGFGNLGPKAFEFVDGLESSGQSWWQMLPICPADETGSPYVSSSTFAGNPLLISLARLKEDGLLSAKDMETHRPPAEEQIEPAQALQAHESLLARAFETFSNDGGAHGAAFTEFCEAHTGWLADYARFRALKRAFGGLPLVGVARGCKA